MATHTISHPAAPPVIPPALPPGLPAVAASSLATPVAPAVSGTGAVGTGAVAAAPGEPNPADSMEMLPLLLRPSVARMPVDLQVIVPIRDFRVRGLLALTPGTVIETQWGNGDDLPLSSGDVQLAWTEFEVVDSRLAVRVTRLA